MTDPSFTECFPIRFEMKGIVSQTLKLTEAIIAKCCLPEVANDRLPLRVTTWKTYMEQKGQVANYTHYGGEIYIWTFSEPIVCASACHYTTLKTLKCHLQVGKFSST